MLDTRVRKTGRKWQPAPIFLPGKTHGQGSLAGNSLHGHKTSDRTDYSHTNYVNSCKYKQSKCYVNSCQLGQALFFGTFWDFFPPYIFNTDLVESTDMEPADVEDLLCCGDTISMTCHKKVLMVFSISLKTISKRVLLLLFVLKKNLNY